ncbi:MAG: amino acid ABC transporter permease [Chloroflexota bacterium]
MFSFKALMYALPFLLRGVGLTVWITVMAVALGTAIGLLVGLCRLSSIKPLSWLATVYVEVVRGTPLLVQLYIVYFGLPQMGIRFNQVGAAVAALAFNSGAYVSEIVRAGILSVGRKQSEAAYALGLSGSQTMRLVVLPQAVRVMVPPLGNEFVTMIKESSLASTIGAQELIKQAQFTTSRTFQVFSTYIGVAIIYFCLTTVTSFALRRVERRVSRGV